MKPLKIAIQGTAGAFHDIVARRYFGNDIEVSDSTTFREVAQKVTNEAVDFGVMAIENSIAGSILPNYALLREYHLKIIGEVYHRIEMNLMVLPGVTMKDIQYVHSHPMAILQCAEFLQTMPHVKVMEKSDTAGAAKNIRENNLTDTAAIASTDAAKKYELTILERRIETNKKNYTRFFILTSRPPKKADARNKASVCFEVGHQPGSLARALNILAEYQINMTKIQSIPILGRPNEYTFHLDLEFSDTSKYDQAIALVLKNVSSLSILGEYEKGEFNSQLEN